MKKGFLKIWMLYLSCLLGCVDHGHVSSQLEVPPDSGNVAKRKSAETQIFGQTIRYVYPERFVPVFQQTTGGSYIKELVPKGESTGKWSEMITLTGGKGVARHPAMTPKSFAELISEGFHKSCPESFSSSVTGAKRISDRDAYVTTVGCGVDRSSGAPRSEAVVLIVLAGENDFYTVQWAERGAPSKTPINLDNPKWQDRLQYLLLIELLPPQSR